MSTDLPEIIQAISQIYYPLSGECMADLLEVSRVLPVEKETTIVREGQHSDKLYFIAAGCVRAYYLKDGRSVTDWFAFENDFICAINSFFQQVPSPHFMEALEPCTLLEISRENVNRLSDKHPDFDRLGKKVITKTMLRLQQRIVSLQFETAQQKYDNLLAVRPDITLRAPLTSIASYLGISLETLSRIRNPKNRI